jgi:hypothetical protein
MVSDSEWVARSGALDDAPGLATNPIFWRLLARTFTNLQRAIVNQLGAMLGLFPRLPEKYMTGSTDKMTEDSQVVRLANGGRGKDLISKGLVQSSHGSPARAVTCTNQFEIKLF